MIDHNIKKILLSTALTAGMTKDEKDRLQDQFIRARPFLKQLVAVAEKEMEKTVRTEEFSVDSVNTIISNIGRRSGLRYIVDLIKK